MTTLHAKSPCCGAKVWRYSHRRRQCTQCKHTWSIRKKMYGRKRKRTARVLLERVLLDKHTIAQERKRLAISKSGVAKRYTKAMREIVDSPHPTKLPKGQYALIADGAYFRFNRREWVLYIMALKPTNSDKAYFLDPVLIKGQEKCEAWRKAIDTIPPDIRKRICAFVTDGLRGSQRLSEENGWHHQRCQFHLLASLVRGKSKRRYCTRGGTSRDQILKVTRIILTSQSNTDLKKARAKLRILLTQPTCVAYIRKHAIEFLEREDDFRMYLYHPELNLPTTTNAVESTVRMVRGATRTARTPESLLLRATVFLRLKKFVVCNGEENQQN